MWNRIGDAAAESSGHDDGYEARNEARERGERARATFRPRAAAAETSAGGGGRTAPPPSSNAADAAPRSRTMSPPAVGAKTPGAAARAGSVETRRVRETRARRGSGAGPGVDRDGRPARFDVLGGSSLRRRVRGVRVHAQEFVHASPRPSPAPPSERRRGRTRRRQARVRAHLRAPRSSRIGPPRIVRRVRRATRIDRIEPRRRPSNPSGPREPSGLEPPAAAKSPARSARRPRGASPSAVADASTRGAVPVRSHPGREVSDAARPLAARRFARRAREPREPRDAGGAGVGVGAEIAPGVLHAAGEGGGVSLGGHHSRRAEGDARRGEIARGASRVSAPPRRPPAVRAVHPARGDARDPNARDPVALRRTRRVGRRRRNRGSGDAPRRPRQGGGREAREAPAVDQVAHRGPRRASAQGALLLHGDGDAPPPRVLLPQGRLGAAHRRAPRRDDGGPRRRDEGRPDPFVGAARTRGTRGRGFRGADERTRERDRRRSGSRSNAAREEPSREEPARTAAYRRMSKRRARTVLQRHLLGFARLRLLPKAAGLRPVAMLGRPATASFEVSEGGSLRGRGRRRPRRSGHARVPTRQLEPQGVFDVLRREAHARPGAMGANVSDYREAHRRLGPFIRSWRAEQRRLFAATRGSRGGANNAVDGRGAPNRHVAGPRAW